MNAERAYDRNHHEDPSAFSAKGSIVLVASGPSRLSDPIVSDPIYENGIFRFSVTSQRRFA
jgi:hypothetical protein